MSTRSFIQVCPQATQATVSVSTAGQARQVVVTPISRPTTSRNLILSKIYLRAVRPNAKKSDGKTFTLRNIDTQQVTTCKQLKGLIRAHLGDDVQKEFDVGYLKGNSVVNLRSVQDISEIWQKGLGGSEVTLWCDGLGLPLKKKGTKRKRKGSDSDSDEEVKKTKQEEKDDKIQTIIDKLMQLHGEKYVAMQYRIWAEMVDGGMNNVDYYTPPKGSMFRRAGGDEPSARKKDDSESALTKALTNIASAISPQATPLHASPPSKKIDGRSKCYKQLADLKNLKESNILTEEEFKVEREAILGILNNLK